MSSVAVLTPESFAEHRSGLKDQEMTGNVALRSIDIHLLVPQRFSPNLLYLMVYFRGFFLFYLYSYLTFTCVC